jgi:hypothetical protein
MKRTLSALLVGGALCLTLLADAGAQEVGDSAAFEGEALRVFVDCRSRYCDFDHFRREIAFVNYMRDRHDAHVHVLVTTRRTGSGGDEFTLAFIGQDEFEAVDDSLQYFSSDTDTEDEVRSGLTRTLKLGLVRYVARTPVAEQLDVTYEAPDELVSTPQVVEDPWNFWIFRIRVGGDLGGEEKQSFFSGNGSLSANRTTEEWKIRLFASGWYSEDHFTLSDSSELTSITRNYGGGGFAVKSLGDHWSLGANAEVRVSTFRNQDLATEIGPAIEYNIYPYAESTRRSLTFVYVVQLNYYDYTRVTIFDKTTETRPSHFLEISLAARQPWGTAITSFEASSFLDHFSQHRLDLSGRLNVRLVRGLQLNMHGSIARTKDQIYLARDEATDEEVLLRRRELGTDYRYFFNLSLSYTFGSIFNNVVNPRFD